MVAQSATSGCSEMACYVIVKSACMPSVSNTVFFFKDTGISESSG